MSPNQDCIRDCNRDFPNCESDCDLNQFLILGRTDFPTYEANGVTDEIIEFKNFQYHHHEVDMERGRKFSQSFIRSGSSYFLLRSSLGCSRNQKSGNRK